MRKPNLFILIPLLIILFMLLIKLFLVFYSNLGFNEAMITYIASSINEGKLPYKDIFDHKSPLIYYSLAFFYKLFGQSIQNMHLLALFFDIALMLAIFFITRKFYNMQTALYAAALYSVFINFVFYDTEIPMALFGLIGIFFYLAALKKKKYFPLILSGIFLALSVWFKQPAILFPIAILIHQFYLVRKKDIELKQLFKNSYFLLGGILIISLPLLSYFIYTAGFKTFFYHLITFNIEFSGSTSRILQIGKLFRILFSSFGILFALIFFSFSALWKETYPYGNRLLIFLSCLLFFFFLINKELFFNHLIQLIPSIILLAVAPLARIKDKKIQKLILIILLFAMLTFCLVTLENLARDLRGGAYKQQSIIASYITENISKEAKIFSDSPIYYVLSNHNCSYKVCFLAPSVASVFSFNDFCNFSVSQNYLILTHRKKYLGQENLECIEDKFILQEKFDNIDESYVEIWKKK